ncbi:MAG: acetyl-CoA carboxylase, biotin carboxyl carrier protein [Steroidobacteraceae bacterium]|nr:acetyl-CoA carboxylase, biotin carboxyl carrier protein [Steroidobacteraceae bacterium]
MKLCLKRGAAVERSAAPAAAGAPNAGAAPLAGAGANAAARANPASAPAASSSAGTGSAASSPQSGPAHAAPAATAQDPNVHEIASPLLGTFYRAPKPGAPPFVEVGSEVQEDTVVAIIEVMKLMNTVRAGVRGRVTEVLAADGVLVEYGQALFRVSKTG